VRTLLLGLVCIYLYMVLVMPGCSFGLVYTGVEDGLDRAWAQSPLGPELSYLRAGDTGAQRIIFIHGSPGQAAAYDSYLHDPIPGLEIVAVDRLGYGGSRESGPVTSFEEQAAAIAPLLVERNGRWPIVVGHSLGAPIAARLAADYPGKVGRIILIGGPFDPQLEQLKWYNTAADLAAVSVTLDERLRISNREMFAAKKELKKLAPLLESIECPVTVLHGTKDSLVPYRHVDFLSAQLASNPRLRVITLAGEDHFITRQRPGEVRQAIQAMREQLAAD
jgi:pimeloyl-ACP methyl ester carboxylesterase